MAEPFRGEIRIMSFNFAPKGWAKCDGQLLPINQNQALFALLGTTYGGNGQTTFALPNLQGRLPMHESAVHPLGQSAGAMAHTLTVPEVPQHVHVLSGFADAADQSSPVGNALAKVNATQFGNAYGPPRSLELMDASAVTNSGGSQAHSNMQPYLTLNICIALEGIFPSVN